MTKRLRYDIDEAGREVLLKEGKFQVMMEWEKPYMQACIDALRPCGHVLEIGFGLGYSAEAIQRYKPVSHTIVECDAEVAERARAFAAEHPGVVVVENTWQQALDQLGVFDCVFFDDYPLESEQQMQQQQRESSEADALLQTGRALLADVQQQVPFLFEIQYSDADLAEFKGAASLHTHDEVLRLARFFKELAQRGQIRQEQYHSQVRDLVSSGKLLEAEAKEILEGPPTQGPFAIAGPKDRLLEFLSRVLPSHMRAGSRFSCFLSSADSKYLDERFCKEIIENPWLDYHEEQMEIEVPSHCHYYSGDKALVMTITRQGDSPHP
jgi:hypothetical protein